MKETISVTDNPYLIPYTSKYFEAIVNIPQKAEFLASTQQPINLKVNPYIATIRLKTENTCHYL